MSIRPRVRLLAAAIAAAPLSFTACKGCSNGSESPAATTTAGSGAASAPASAAPSASAVATSKLKLLANAAGPLTLAGAGKSAIVIAANVGVSIEDGKVTENPDLLHGLENPLWLQRRFVGTASGAFALLGKRDPSTLWPGDAQMYGENVEHCGEQPGPNGRSVPRFCLPADELTVRAFQLGAWIRRDPREKELGGVGRLFGRLLVAVTDDDDGPDYEFRLLAGKPGISLPRRTKLPKKSDEPEAAPAPTTTPSATTTSTTSTTNTTNTTSTTAVPTGSAPAAPSAAASASAAPSGAAQPSAVPSAAPSAPATASASAPPPPPASATATASASASSAPLDAPKVPVPSDPRCRSRVLPIAFDGLDSGEMFLLGRACGGAASELWIEHWAKPSATSDFIPLTGLSDPRRATTGTDGDAHDGTDDLAVAATESGVAYVAQRSTGTLLEVRGQQVSRLEPPVRGPLDAFAASAGGRLWILVDGRVFYRSGKDAWQEVPLPAGKRATALAPSDDDTPFVACGSELYGPALALPEVLDLSGTVTSLCLSPWVLVNADLPANDDGKADAARARATGVAGVSLFTGYRGMGGKRTLESKAPDLASARALASALKGASIVCSAPRGATAMK